MTNAYLEIGGTMEHAGNAPVYMNPVIEIILTAVFVIGPIIMMDLLH